MTYIIPQSQLQKKGSEITKKAHQAPCTIVNRGKGNVVILPYFEGNDEAVEDYWESYLMHKNKDKLQKELIKSKQSGHSDLVL